MRVIYLFDVDGTLLLSGGAGSRALDRVFASRYGLVRAMAAIDLGGKTDPQILGEVFAQHLRRAPELGELDAIIAAYLPLLADELARTRLRVMPWVGEALDWLEGHPGVPLGLAPGNGRAGASCPARPSVRPQFRLGRP